ncbi:hypothetical protein KI688_000664 [Linnemannia hyalina]|uniref:Uncharacterized protein n=1 Tax=Linnemannia hyalina TaxID=64524 RepID=A0A9P7Y6J5_9FUNG|nr:hypothetical protein KI688_000664 [Linnemannia hyalina]
MYRYDPSRPNFGDIVNSSQDEFQKQSKKRSRTPAHKLKPTIYTFSPLREMVIDIRSYPSGPFNAFPYPQTLTNIALHIRSSGSQHLNLSRILSQCSLLEVLIVEAQHTDRLYLLWDEPTVPQGSLALRSLTLNHATIDHDRLEYLLTSSPHLKALKLISMASSRLHLPTLFHRIKTLPIDLETFHISIHELPWPRGVQQQVFELYPVTSEWNLWAAHMSPSLLKELEVHTPSLTTLELYWRRKGGRVNDEKSPDEIIMASRLLFKFLCESSHAVHLMTLKAGIFHQDMDLYRRGRYSNRNKQAVDVLPPALQGSPTCSGIWRCRDLRVLHINLRDPIASLKRRQQSRIVYGYISKVVPHLEELEIFYPYYNTPEGSFVSGSQNNYRIPMVLEGGFCLLGRLRHLRRLSVISAEGKTTASCKKVDLNWMVPEGRGDDFKEKKQLEVESWQQQQLVEEEERFRAQDQEQKDDAHVTGDNGDPLDNELRDQFRSLGLLREVAEMITKIDAGSLVPFPSLTGLSFEHPMLQAPEKVVAMLADDKGQSGAYEPDSSANESKEETLDLVQLLEPLKRNSVNITSTLLPFRIDWKNTVKIRSAEVEERSYVIDEEAGTESHCVWIYHQGGSISEGSGDLLPYFIVNRAPEHIYAAKLCMQLEGGFCLLGRLRYLQRLRVYAAGGGITGLCQEMDLNWIVPSGRSDKFKELRQQEIASWQSLRLVEDQCDQAQQQQDDGDGSGDKDGSLDAEVRDQFRNLGLLMDVEEAINEIDGGSLVPFPSLTGLSFVYPILQRPEKALNQLFPKPKLGFGLCKNNNNGTIKNDNNGAITKNDNKETIAALTIIVFTITNTLTTNTTTLTADTTTITYSALQQVNTGNPSPTANRTIVAYSHPTTQPINSTIPRSVVWDSCSRSQARLDTVPLRLVGAARFFCYLEKESDPNIHDAVAKIFAHSQEQYRKQAEMKETRRAVGSAAADRKRGTPKLTTKSTTATTLRRFSPLQELYFTIDNISEQAIYNTFPYPSTLTKFVLKVDYWKFNLVIPFADILRSCPHLGHFEAHDTPDLSLLWTPEVADYHQHQYPLALRTFILYNTKIPQASLETLLAATPKLKVLKVIGMSWYNTPYDWTRLLDHLLSLPISLDAIHLSSLTEPMSDDISHRILDACTSALSEWNLLAHDISTQLLKDLEIYTDRLTTLEVYSQPPSCRRSVRDHCCQYDLKNAPEVLHVFLTSPDNENTLLHLKTLKTIARLEDFDIHHREGYILPENPHRGIRPPEICAPTGPPKVWRCQGLRTLHVEIHALGDYHLNNPAHSRIIFGYISRVFPLLEELQVQIPRECIMQRESRSYSPKLCLQLEGGLCLLSRLKYLERLRLVWNRTSSSGINFEESDMNWMVPSGRKRKCTEKRREKVKAWPWQWQRIQEDVSETRRLRREQGQRKGEEERAISSGGNGAAVSPNTDVLRQLRDLGLLSDVEEMIKEIDESKSFIPLPSLEGLSLGHHHFAQPESEIKRCCHLHTSAGAWKQLLGFNERIKDSLKT